MCNFIRNCLVTKAKCLLEKFLFIFKKKKKKTLKVRPFVKKISSPTH